MARITYSGYGITELRSYAKQYKIRGRSKMDGYQLYQAVADHWDAERQANEAAILPAVKIGAVLRHKSSGYTIRITSEVQVWSGVRDALFVTAEYVELDGWGDDTASRVRRAAYQNAEDARRTERGDIVRHPLWQYEAV
jgi:hypothetical protein